MTCRYAAVALVCLAAVGPASASAEPAEALPETLQTVRLIRHAGQQSSAWYTRQVELWSRQVAADPADARGWYCLYLATEYAARPEESGVESGAENGAEALDARLDELLERMARAVPESYQLPYLQARRLALADRADRRPLLARAYERCPTCPDVLEDMALQSEIDGDTETAAGFWRAVYDTGDIAAGLLDYNYNALQSVDENGILLTNGDNDTFPAWILQRVHQVRPDVLVLNLSLARHLPGYLVRVLSDHRVGVDASVLPADDPAAFVSAFCAAAAAVRPDRPVFAGLTVAHQTYLSQVEDNLQMVGLAYVYAPRPLDNTARLRRNLEQRFRLDHLRYSWNTEGHISTVPVVHRLRHNYCYPALLLSRHLDLAGDLDGAARWRELALAAAGSNAYLLEQVRNRLEGDE